MKYKNIILLSDLDGTLLDSKNRVSKKNQEAIDYFIFNGGRFGVATGRSPINAKQYINNISINLPSILYNGCALYDFNTEEYLEIKTLNNKKLMDYLFYCLATFKEVVIQVYTSEMCYVVSPELLADPEVISLHQPCTFINLNEISHLPWIKILFSGNKDELKEMALKIKEYELENEIHYVFTAITYLEFLPINATKGSMLEKLREISGKDYKIYAVGDYYNDEEMLKAADVGIATENALPSLKETADMITVSNEDSAIADIIYNIIK